MNDKLEMKKGNNQRLTNATEPYRFPAPASTSGTSHQNLIDTTGQWVYHDTHDYSSNAGFIPPTSERNPGKQPVLGDFQPLRDPRNSGHNESSFAHNSYMSTQLAQEPEISVPKQLPETIKFLAPTPAPDYGAYTTNDLNWDLSDIGIPYGDIPLHLNTPYVHHTIESAQYTQPLPEQYATPSLTQHNTIASTDAYLDGGNVFYQQPPASEPQLSKGNQVSAIKRKKSWSSPPPSPKPNNGATRKTAQPKRRRQRSPSPIGRDGWMSDETLCWRCGRHNTNHLISGFCDTCIRISNFNVAPSTQGTRRESLETHMEEHLRTIPRNTLKNKSWRVWTNKGPKRPNQDFENVVFRDHFTLAQEQVLSLHIIDYEYVKLIAIAQRYQESTMEPNKSLEASCRILVECCELYKCFIETTNTPTEIPLLTLLEKIRTARSTMRRAFREYQALALSPSDFRSRRDWLPSFLSACNLAVSAIIFLDMVIVIPSPFKERIWGAKWHDRVAGIRYGGYGMMLAVLKANTKDLNPLALSCWDADMNISNSYKRLIEDATHDANIGLGQHQYQNFNPGTLYANSPYDPTYPTTTVGDHYSRESLRMAQKARALEERDILLGANSPEALQGMMDVKSWQIRNYEHLKQGEDLFKKEAYRQAQLNPIASLWRIFEME